jgi:adenosylcobinamide-GDP ribazoletransferase
MPDSDRAPDPGFRPGDIRLALALLSRLPVAADHAASARRGAVAAWAYPLAGAVLGGLGALAGGAAAALGAPPGVAAGVALGALALITGAMHEDGLADSADGLWGGWNRARRLEIMKDSRIGAYGVIALIVVMLMRWSALATLAATGGLFWAMVAAGALSRAPMAVAMHLMRNARGSGLSAGVGTVPGASAGAAAALAVVIAVLACGWTGVVMAAWAALAALAVCLVARARIGGQTGDILGAAQQTGEAAALAAAAA